MKLFDVYPINDINLVRAQGSRVWDDAGNRYLDMYGGHAVISIGHTHPHWVSRIETQLRAIPFYSNSVRIPIQDELAGKLAAVSGKEGYQLFLCNSGAEANENALKLASFHTGRKTIVSFQKAFHGRTSLAVAATDNPAIVAPVNQTGSIVFLPFDDADAVAHYFEAHGHDVAAVIVEPIQGVGGIRVAGTLFLQQIRASCTQYGALMIADEVQCGCGRSGSYFMLDQSGIDADVYTMAKGIGNGFPVGSLLIAPYIKPWHGMLGTTFGGNHLACAAALGVLEVMETEQLVQKAGENGCYLKEQLQTIPGLLNVRGAGLMIGFDVPDVFKDLRKKLLSEHFMFTGEAKPSAVRLLPSLTITREELDEFLAAVRCEMYGAAASKPVRPEERATSIEHSINHSR